MFSNYPLTGQVHSFEPTPRTFDLLRINTEGKSNVFLNQTALSSVRGEVTFNDYGVGYMGSNSRYQARMDNAILSRLTPERFDVCATTLDDYVETRGITPNFVKIDAESSEFEILQGMAKTLARTRPIVSVEVGDMDIEGVPTSRDLINHLIDNSYRAYEFAHGEFADHHIKDRYTYDNILFIPEV